MPNQDGSVVKMSRAGEWRSVRTNTGLGQRAESRSAAPWEPGVSPEAAPRAPLGSYSSRRCTWCPTACCNPTANAIAGEIRKQNALARVAGKQVPA